MFFFQHFSSEVYNMDKKILGSTRMEMGRVESGVALFSHYYYVQVHDMNFSLIACTFVSWHELFIHDMMRMDVKSPSLHVVFA